MAHSAHASPLQAATCAPSHHQLSTTSQCLSSRALQQPRLYRSGRSSNKLLSRESPQNSEALLSRLGSQPHISLNVGVLQYTPSSQPFPLLDPRIKVNGWVTRGGLQGCG